MVGQRSDRDRCAIAAPFDPTIRCGRVSTMGGRKPRLGGEHDNPYQASGDRSSMGRRTRWCLPVRRAMVGRVSKPSLGRPLPARYPQPGAMITLDPPP